MVNKCCAYGCKEKFRKNSGISFHSFPKDPYRRKLWALSVRRKNFQPSIHAKLCSKHFTEECFDREKFGASWLKPIALPTIFNFAPQLDHKESCTQHGKVSTSHLSPANNKWTTNNHESAVKDAASHLLVKLEPVSNEEEKYIDFILSKRAISQHRTITNLSVILEELVQKGLISEDAKDALEKIEVTVENLKAEKYTSELRDFALTLFFYSPQAYDYIRNMFDTCLPHRRTLRTWYEVSMADILDDTKVTEPKILVLKS